MLHGCLLLILALHEVHGVSFEMPMRPIYYLKGVVDPTQDPISTDVTDGCHVVVTRQGVHCSGQQCRSISGCFTKKNITTLTIKYTNIEMIVTRSFSNYTNLITLDVIQSRVRLVYDDAFANLQHLQVLNLAVNEITKLSSFSLRGLTKLKELVLVNNRITSISDVLPAILPSVLPSLDHLELANNRLTVIDQSSFKGMEESPLRFLILMLCDLDDIHPDAFKPLRSLKGVMLRGNDRLQMKSLVSLFQRNYYQNLKEVDISSMSFNKIPTPLLSVLGERGIRVLFMTSMRFSQIFSGQFPPMPHLEVLYLNNDRIADIDDNSLTNLTSLKEVYLKRNIITELPRALLLPTLEVLDVSGFPSQALKFIIPDRAFRNTSRLKNLTMSFKNLSLRKETFYGLSNLKRLVIYKCAITNIENNTFQYLTSLEYLDISGNGIFQTGLVANLAFNGLQASLKSFIAQDVGLDDINVVILQTMHNVELLDLSNNTLTSLNFLVKNDNLTMLSSLVVPFNFIAKWDDQVVVNTVNLLSVDLSHNDIREVTPSMMDDFDTLLNLNLSHNPFNCNCDIRTFIHWLNHTNVTVFHYHNMTPLAKSRQENYVCSGPSQLVHTPLYELQNSLNDKCQAKKGNSMTHAVFISLAVLLIFILGGVFVLYMFRKHVVYYWTRTKKGDGSYLYDAFVSYSAVDSQWVFDALLPHLENTTSNLRLCVYDRDFLAGNAITDCILESIRRSRKIILVISNNFLLSPWCRLETELASHILVEEKRDGLLLIKMEELKSDKVSSQLKFLLQTRLHLTWTQDIAKQKEFWNKLHRALQGQIPHKNRQLQSCAV